ncbi:Holliday junction branch migration protein RuvA [Kitasatospora atroaurantiaca]|uniref:Holliday junction branch migration complex subunit RuvA n=1 Tax=Kitasatospora atroaurantiaca TaxID=285545 RepID=A0A561EZD4_9ACTN|nr:Holliday junction branch migration protein RuvA [Kitasatospora atroaurantiaca]TWE20971.1 Holliday junction DNA helicase subunit RuvA [Kitasatospora atroaurantiaca]
MIAFVQGPVAAVTPGSAVVEVGGVGMLVKCTPRTLAELRIGQHTRLTTSLIVKEDSLTLYGFTDEDERATFEILLTASGVAATMALAMLGVFTPDELRRVVAQGDAKSLTAVPRIGPKLAQKLLLEYKDKLGAPHGSVPAQKPIAAGPAPWQDQLQAALVGLGYAPREADEAVTAVTPEAEEQAVTDVGALLKAALRTLNRTR